MYVAGEDALDQFFCRHPDEFLERPVEAAILDHESQQIYQAHLLCAAHEGPLERGDAEFFGPRLAAGAEALVSAGLLRERVDGQACGGQYVLRRPADYPAAKVSLRSASPEHFAIVDVSSGELLGQTEAARAYSTVHDGADLPAPRAAPTRCASWTSRTVARSWRRSTATGTRSPSARPTPRSSACWTAARRSA